MSFMTGSHNIIKKIDTDGSTNKQYEFKVFIVKSDHNFTSILARLHCGLPSNTLKLTIAVQQHRPIKRFNFLTTGNLQ